MSGNLQQIQLTYDKTQDRLVLVFFTLDFCEYRFWITRAVTKGLCEIIKKLLNEMMQDETQQREEERKADAAVKKERQQPQANKFATRITKCPFGETPLLLYKIMAKHNEQGAIHFRLEDLDGKSIEFMGDLKFLHVLSQLIHKAILQTDWNQPVEPMPLS